MSDRPAIIPAMGLLTGYRLARRIESPLDGGPRPGAALESGEVDPFLAPVAVAAPVADAPWWSKDTERAVGRIVIDVALQLGAVRKAQHVIAGTIGTWDLDLYKGDDRVPDSDPRAQWLAQPAATRSRPWLLTRTVQDLIWRDRCVWRITDRTLLGAPTSVERVHPDRLDTITHPRDPDTVTEWMVDGKTVAPSNLVIFDGAGIGGVQRYGYELLTLYGQLQAAAGRYARAPHPHAILKNRGEDLDDDEIAALLASWEAARGTSSTAYVNDAIEYITAGYNARELQLTEARELAALDVARMFGLPAFALDAQSGDSMTYSNVTDQRSEIREALRPWTSCIEGALSLDNRTGRPTGTVVPHGYSVRFDTVDYLREKPAERAGTYAALIAAGVMDAPEARQIEPLTRNLP